MVNLDFLSNDYKDRRSQQEIIQEKIEIDIITGKIPNGKRISEQSLSDAYNMSRTPIREILRRIEGNGLCELIPNRGVFAKGVSHKDLEDIAHLKAILEPQVTAWAIERIEDSEMDQLSETFDFMEFYTASNDLDKILRINDGFDLIIYNAAHNDELEKLLKRYNFILKHALTDILYPFNYLPTVLEEHRAIYQAFLDRDPIAGKEAARSHMEKTILRKR